MKVVEANSWLIDSYLRMLRTLDPQHKLDLISKLTESVKTDISHRELFWESYGAWDKEENAEDVIKGIRDSRHFTRTRESL